jgi:CIC family chloride channel protein
LLLFLGAVGFFKVVATSLTIGSGGNGGIFAGSLFTGAITGFVFARLVSLSQLIVIQEVNFVATGMAGVIAGVIHAPLTGIFLIAEITGGYSLFVPLMIVAAMSYFITRYFEPASVYSRPLKEAGAHFSDDRDTFLLNSIELKDLVETEIEVIERETPLRQVVERFTRSKQNIFPVVDGFGKFHGIILLEDLKDLLFEVEKNESLRAKDLLIQPPALIRLGEQMPAVMQKFDTTGVWKLPVVYDGDLFVGFVSKKKIFTQYRELLRQYSQGDIIS